MRQSIDSANKAAAPNSIRATPAEKARQGPRGRPVLIVLLAGLVFAAIAWTIAGIYGEAGKDTAPQNQPAATSTVAPPDDAVVGGMPIGEPTRTAPTDRDPTPESGSGGDPQSITPTGTQKTQ